LDEFGGLGEDETSTSFVNKHDYRKIIEENVGSGSLKDGTGSRGIIKSNSSINVKALEGKK